MDYTVADRDLLEGRKLEGIWTGRAGGRSLSGILLREVCLVWGEEKGLAVFWHPRCSRLSAELSNVLIQLVLTSLSYN